MSPVSVLQLLCALHPQADATNEGALACMMPAWLKRSPLQVTVLLELTA